MNAQDIRKAYLDFFKKQHHAVIPRALLVPQNDATTLFTGSGMQPLIPYLLGEAHPEGTRLVNSQTCIRAQDIEEVGDRTHTTFFEMLGNWSLGDYSKEDQIRWFFTFLTEKVGLDPHKLYVTCFIGSKEHNIPRDDEAAAIWQKLFAEKGIEAKIAVIGSQADGDKRGIKEGERIFFYDDGENWWSRNGGIASTPIGDPCGPDSEVFYDFGEQNHDTSVGLPHPASDGGRFMEIGNQVFMQYRRLDDGSFEPLEKLNVDYGGGLERIAAAAIDSPDVYKISLLWPIIEKLEQLSGKKYESHTNAMRVIADHLRGATFLAVDGVKPSNKEQGYVMRRLVRRAIRFAFDLGIEQNFLPEITPVITNLYHDDYPEVAAKRTEIIDILVREEKAFRTTIRKGIKEFNKLAEEKEEITGSDVFKLYDTYGFPVELTIEEAFHWNKPLEANWRSNFDRAMQEQRQRSQTASKGVFKGGLGGQTLQHKKYHTATHLMYQALRDVLGDHVIQRGSNITEERLRFDFSHPEKVTAEQLKQVEDIVNDQIAKDLKVSYQEYPTEEALKMGALGQFGDRYGDTVKVYKMIADDAKKPFSFEICGGPHVEHTLQLFEDGKRFKIIKEEASSAGVRRIKAVLA
ncbi:MAG TPA: alanine--tRNA ligase-related protein [Verrucomicrobiae bacterium]|nr:alanine--tRNA ligase-related protein [Verrucomicrobiae bacterium]